MNQIEVAPIHPDARDRAAKESMENPGIESVKVTDVYYIEGDVSGARSLFYDELTQKIPGPETGKGAWVVESRYKDAVSDPAEDSIRKALESLGGKADSVRTARRYYVRGRIGRQEIEEVCKKLANGIVEDCFFGFEKAGAPEPKPLQGSPSGEIREISVLNSEDSELESISREGMLALSLEEMKAIKKHFMEKGRNPTDGEMETVAQTWSEHCKHKTLNSRIEFDNNGKTENFENLFKETIVAATQEIAPEKDWLVSIFKDNAGIISFDEKYDFAFKVETHNHPSALDPYGGASTGIGGVIRDIMGAGLGAKPIFNTDVFCFAPEDYGKKIPGGIIHPKRVFRGVVSGVRDYGNRMGIPTVNGAIVYHEDYLGAPLVYCGTGGILPKGMDRKKAHPGDLIVSVGGKTGRDGLRGATFSSAVLNENSPSSAVQIGNPIEEKKVLDALLQARDRKLYTCITDCGAGGFSSAIGEMAQETGAEVNLEKVPIKHAGMMPWEIWMSESQERMIISVPEKNLAEVQEIFKGEDVAASVIGRFTSDKKLTVKFEESVLVDMDMEFLHGGMPAPSRKAAWRDFDLKEPELQEKENYNEELKKILAHPSIASKEEVIRRYDHEVQGGTIVKPLVGTQNDGPADAAVIRPEFGDSAIVVSNGINPRYGFISSYWMAASAIDEALRNSVASGGDPDRTALLDNFCWGSTESEEKMGSLVMAAKACRDVATGFGTPFISGKDSLHNEFRSGDRIISIPDTLLISAASVIKKRDAVTMDLKEEGSSLYILGQTRDELGGSYFYELHGEIGKNVPRVNAAEARKSMKNLTKAMRSGLVLSCHDCSEGGMAVAAAEMAFSGGVGLNIDAGRVPGSADRNYKILFSESNSRFLIEVRKESEKEFEKITGAAKIGETVADEILTISGDGRNLIEAGLKDLKEAWKGTVRW